MSLERGVQAGPGVLSFAVATARGQVHAFLSTSTCEAGTGRRCGAQGLAQFLQCHRPALDRIVAAKVHAGARHPVVLTARDLAALAVAVS